VNSGAGDAANTGVGGKAKIPAHVPAHVSADVPAHVPADVSVHVTAHVAADVSVHVPAHVAANIPANIRVLDFGCGTGHFIKRFRRGYEAWAYDASAYAVEATSALAPHVNVRGEIAEIPRGAFDLVVSLHVLEHIEEPIETLRLFAELLRPGGVLLYATSDASGLGRRLKKENWAGYRDPSHVALFASDEWLRLTLKAGFKIIKTGADGLWDVPYTRGKFPRWLEKIILYPVPALQVLTGRLILPRGWGESLIVAAQKTG
jgi:SAM-dependent methyltransferase